MSTQKWELNEFQGNSSILIVFFHLLVGSVDWLSIVFVYVLIIDLFNTAMSTHEIFVSVHTSVVHRPLVNHELTSLVTGVS